jgi:23S rRNA-/tRNA-specific pseudouridylate synthase
MMTMGTISENSLCDVYTAKMVEGKLYFSIPDTRNHPDQTTITETDAVPETVLQYERQMRKVNAAKKAEAPLRKKDHLKVIHQDEHLIVADKPSGILCVPGINNHSSLLTLIHQEFAPTIHPIDKLVVHRLDMDTSGLVVFARTLEAATELHKVFRDRTVYKSYEALVCGHLRMDEGVIDLPLQRDHQHPPFMRIATPKSEQAAAQVVQDLQHHGWKKIMRRKPKPSKTEFRVIGRETLQNLPVTRLALKPLTGRTHQLRVHCASIGHPIVADPTYGIYGEASANGGILEHFMDSLNPHRASLELQRQINDLSVNTMCLHAKEISFQHPFTGKAISLKSITPF